MHDRVPSGTLPALAVRQLAAMDAFHEARRDAEAAARTAVGSREARLDAARRLDVVRRQHEALIARTVAALEDSVALMGPTRPRAVVVHRNAWFRDRVAAALEDEGIVVLARLDNGADAVGAAVAEQPELLLLEDPVPMMTGEQVVREVLHYSPGTLIGVQAPDERSVRHLLAAGAGAVFARQVPPVDVARALADALLAHQTEQRDADRAAGSLVDAG